MVGESNQNDFFFIQIDASKFAEFDISEFEISRIDCNIFMFISKPRSSERSPGPETRLDKDVESYWNGTHPTSERYIGV